MLGLLFAELKKYIQEESGEAAWRELTAETEADDVAFAAPSNYDDGLFHDLVGEAATRMGTDRRHLMADLGEFLAGEILDQYHDAIDPSWSTMDVLRRSHAAIEGLLEGTGSRTEGPRFESHLEGANTMVVDWYAPKHMCALAKGVVRGIAARLGDRVDTMESFCMYQGDHHCEMTFRARAETLPPAV